MSIASNETPRKKLKANFWSGFKRKTLSVTNSKLMHWHRRVQEMQKCSTPDALIALHGPPRCKNPQNGFEIWHYPLGIESGMSYSIHVSVSSTQSKQMVEQVFLYFEPVSHQQSGRRWWQFWKKKVVDSAQQGAERDLQ